MARTPSCSRLLARSFPYPRIGATAAIPLSKNSSRSASRSDHVSCNCGLNEIFTERVSRHDARKFRRRGLDKRARKLVRALQRKIDLEGRSTLEIGIGTGGLTVELLRRGVARAVGVDAIANQLAYARELAQEFGVADRLELREGDFTSISSNIGNADVVVLDRVVCCYPDWRTLLDAAATRAGAAVAMSYPRVSWYNRVWISTANLGMRVLRRTFRLHLHSPVAMHNLLRERGFTPQVVGHRFAWELLIAIR
jgi:2-polyprenyl-3-methyl-5-hydroxy-6-metoxy-1,4-benzoquinol methylase